MFARLMLTALAAGFVAGVFLWGGHMLKTTPLILAAEVYETGAALETAPGGGFERAGFTLLTDVLTGIGFAFLLCGAVSLFGRNVDWHQGMVWGLCGFAAFFAAPSLGLAPELPGMQAADLAARQTWWLGTAVATAVGLGLLFLSPGIHFKALGAVLIVLPHIIGAPSHDIAYGEAVGKVPAELASEFAIAVFVVTGLFWIVLGGLVGYFYNRFEKS
ncbi:MAG: CbtA family protein [Proteobacteria bacterium]|nr:CbtA family protein [Pseudomonadota bacterium]